MSSRRHRQELVRWEYETRVWAHEAARAFVWAICTGHPLPAYPYGVGVVLEHGEQPWMEIPARFVNDRPSASSPMGNWHAPVRPWLISSTRITGRIDHDRLFGWRWDHTHGCRFDLRPRREQVVLDAWDGTPLMWAGPGVAPLAVAATYALYGADGLVGHPALESLRCGPAPAATAQR